MDQRPALVIAAGTYSAIAETMICQPLDFIKVRLQMQSTVRRASMYQTMRDAMAHPNGGGGIAALYRGVAPELAGVIPTTSLLFFINDICRDSVGRSGILRSDSSVPPPAAGQPIVLNTAQATLCGALAGVPEGIFLSPFHLVKIRLQSVEHLTRYAHGSNSSSSIAVARSIMASEGGVRALTRGMHATMFRNGIWNGVYFGVIQTCKNQIHALTAAAERAKAKAKAGTTTATAAAAVGGPVPYTLLAGTGIDMLAGAIGGAVATAVNIPFDVAKTRIQSQIPSAATISGGAGGAAAGAAFEYNRTFSTLRHIQRTEGTLALYRGFRPKVLRMALGGGICIAAYDQALHFFNIQQI